ncbi:hypothetical protein FALB51S_04110 [Frigidibacter albus]
MADHFITKSTIRQGELRKTGGEPAVDQYAALVDGLTQLADSDIAALFTTPMIGRNRDGASVAVSWYSDYSGAARPLTSLDGALRADVAERLGEKISVLRTLADAPDTDPDLAKLIDAALCVRSDDDVLVIGGRPVLINWGVAPISAMADPAAMSAHMNATLGVLAQPLALHGLFGSATARPVGTDAAAALAAPEPNQPLNERPDQALDSSPHQIGAGPRGDGPTAPPALWRTAFWPPLFLIALMAMILLWLLLPGTRLFPPPHTQITREVSEGALDLARQLNRDLEERALALEAALDGAVCTPQGDLLLPDGRSPEGLLPPTPGIAAPATEDGARLLDGQSNPLIPPDPGRIQPKEAPGQEGPVASLLALVEPRTVLILAPFEGGTGIGTGFFIAPDLVATNHHVIETAIRAGEVFVVNDALGTPRRAKILFEDGPFEQTGGDFAVLQIAGANAPYYSLLSGGIDVKSEAVMAAGFPSDIIADDLRFQRLIDGSGTEVPDLVVTSGIVNSHQQIADTVSILVHSASISRGNSGGPLVDLCGRVVGINTFIREESFRNLNLAQSMANFQSFLGRSGVMPTYSVDACTPSVRSAPRPTPAESATGEPTVHPEAEASNL